MPKRSAKSDFSDYNFAKAYHELKQLREDVALLERSLSSGRKSVEGDGESFKMVESVQPQR